MTEPPAMQPPADDGLADSDELLKLLYAELKLLAGAKLKREPFGQTLQATALVHEAYLRVNQDGKSKWQSKSQFFAAAAEAMRRILVENARRKQRIKHGGQLQRVPMDLLEIGSPEVREDILALDEALTKFESIDGQATELVKLRYFAGLTLAEAAEQLAIPPRSADRLWAYAKAWLHQELQGTEG